MSEEQLIQTPGVFGENGNFLLERELGKGGMGGVYMGRDKMLDRPVAVKVMLKEYGSDPEFVEKFKKEAQAVARLIHPNIAQVYSYGFSDGMPYIAMELVAGGSLDGLMKHHGKDIEVPRVMKICEQVAQALRCAADQGLVHGDVKPENVLLDANGNAKLVDFGLAAMQKDTNEIWGTPYYIAPEKCRRQPVDYRADMYSLGGTIYHALTGQPPFEGDDATEVVKARFMGAPKKPSELRPGLSPQIDNLVMTMLAVEPKDRFPSFEALLEEFKKVMTTGLSMTSPISPDAATVSAGAAASAKPGTAQGGKKKLVVKPKKGFKVKKPAGAASSGEEAAGDIPQLDENGEPIPGSEGSAGADAKKKYDDDEEEEGGNLGLKILGIVGGVIALIGLVAGLLVWYQASSKASEQAKYQLQIQGGFTKARESLRGTREAAVKFSENMDEFAARTVATCEANTKELRKVLSQKYPEEILAMLKPAETAELIAARAALNAPDQEEAPAAESAPAVPAAPEAPAATNAAPADAAAAAATAAPAAQAPAAPTEAAAPVAPEPPAAPAVEVPSVVKDLAELWVKTYHVQAIAFKMRREVTRLVKKIDAALEITGSDEDTMNKIVNAANDLKDQYETIRGSGDVTSAEKDAGVIKHKGERMIKQTVERMRVAALEEGRLAAKKKARLDDIRKDLEQKRKRLEAAEADVAAAKEAFANAVNSGRLKQFDWRGMKRLLESARAQMESPEGSMQLDKELKKVQVMEDAQGVLIKRLKGYTFAKSKLKGQTVMAVGESDITLKRADGRKAPPLGWQRFYREYHGNLNELINKFIRGGRGGDLKLRLSHSEWLSAMLGTAYVLNVICADDETTAPFVEQLVREAVMKDIKLKTDSAMDEEAPEPRSVNEADEEVKSLLVEAAGIEDKLDAIAREIRKTPFYKEMFPDIDFAKIEEAAANEP